MKTVSYNSLLIYSLASFLLVISTSVLRAQGVVISEDVDDTPDPSAILDVKSTEQGILIPRMTKIQRDQIQTSVGLLIYQTDDSPGFYFFNGSNWEELKGSGTGGVTQEIDPQVGEINNNAVPKWNGSQLVSSAMFENQ